jgi:hypothetical protein
MNCTHDTPNTKPQVFCAPCKQAKRFSRSCPYLFNTPEHQRSVCQVLWYRFFVVPLTNVTVLSLSYQLYLNEIFHTRFLTKCNHLLFMTLGNLYLFHWIRSTASGTLLWLYFFSILAWYVYWAALSRSWMLALCSVPPIAVLFYLSHIDALFLLEANLWSVLAISAVLACGHLLEPKIPARVAGKQWLYFAEFFQKYGYPKAVLLILFQFVCGTIDECVSIPRMFPVILLRTLIGCGYYTPSYWVELNRHCVQAIQSGNPALDFIGVGGDVCLNEVAAPDGKES